MIGSRLRFLREDHDYSLEAVARCIGATRSQIARYEKGIMNPSVATLAKLAKFYGVSMDYIAGQTNEPKRTVVIKSTQASGDSKMGA